MVTSSRWTRWVISDSANPRLPMPWVAVRQRRLGHPGGRALPA